MVKPEMPKSTLNEESTPRSSRRCGEHTHRRGVTARGSYRFQLGRRKVTVAATRVRLNLNPRGQKSTYVAATVR